MTAYTHAESNTRKTFFFIFLFLIILIGFGWLVSRSTGNPSFLYLFSLFASITSIVSFWFSDKIVIGMYHGEEVTRESNKDLYNIVENLSIASGLPMPRVYIVPEAQPNAFATGRDKNHAVIAVTEGLLDKLDKAELEGVIAHEFSHIGNKDMLLGTVIVVLVGVISVTADIFLRMSMFGGRDRDREEGGNAMFILAVIAAVLAPIAATLIQLAISRKREFLADASGALITRYPEGLASALEKISADPDQMSKVSNATAHLWFASPTKKENFIAKMFMTHPPIEERVAALRNMDL